MPYRPKGSLVWWTSKPWRESTGTRDEEQAKLYEAQLVIDAKRGTAVRKRVNHARRVDHQELSLSAALDRWSVEEGKRSSYHSDLSKSVVDAFGDLPLAAIDNRLIADAVVGMVKAGNAASTVNKKLRRLQVVLDRAVKVWDVKVDSKIDFSLHRRKGAKKKHTYFLSHEMENKIHNLYADEPDFQDFMAVSIETGMRTSEVLQLTRDDVDFRSNRLHVRNWSEGQSIKTGEVRSVPMTQRCLEVMQSRAHLVKPFAVLKTDLKVRKLWQRAVDKFNLPVDKGATPRCFRRTCGTRLAELGFSQAEIAAWLGHKNAASTEHYVNIVSSRVDRMRELIDNARPIRDSKSVSTVAGLKTLSKTLNDEGEDQRVTTISVCLNDCFSKEYLLAQPFWEQDVGSSNLSTPTNSIVTSSTYSFKIDQKGLKDEDFE